MSLKLLVTIEKLPQHGEEQALRPKGLRAVHSSLGDSWKGKRDGNREAVAAVRAGGPTLHNLVRDPFPPEMFKLTVMAG